MATVNNYRNDKDVEFLIKIFRREVDKEGILNEMKDRKYFKKDSTINHETKKKYEYKMARKLKIERMKEAGIQRKAPKKTKKNENKSNHQDQTYL